jgi:hypothetical protein
MLGKELVGWLVSWRLGLKRAGKRKTGHRSAKQASHRDTQKSRVRRRHTSRSPNSCVTAACGLFFVLCKGCCRGVPRAKAAVNAWAGSHGSMNKLIRTSPAFLPLPYTRFGFASLVYSSLAFACCDIRNSLQNSPLAP